MALLMGLSGCGRVGFEPSDTLDGGGDAASSVCTPWEPATLLAALSTGSDDWEPALSPDGNTLVFGRGGSLLVGATRTGDTFDTPVVLASLDATGALDLGPAWLPSGTELYFTSDRLSSDVYRLWQSTFSGGTFQTPTQVAELAATEVFAPTVRRDGLEMYFNNSSSGSDEIYRAVRATPTAPWTIDGVQSQLTLDGGAGWSTLSSDGLTLYYEHEVGADLQIYMATRATQDERFGSAAIVSELATGAPNGDPELSFDGTTLYFASDPVGTATLFDLYYTTRTCAQAAP